MRTVVAESTGLEDPRGEWQTLFAASPAATPFMAPSWARAWWTHWGAGMHPLTIATREGEQLVGLATLALMRRGPLRILTTVGMEPGDYWDLLALPGRSAEVAELVAAELARRRGTWDALILRGLPPDSSFPRALTEAGLNVIRRSPLAAPAIELPERYETYVQRLPAGRRQNLRRHLKRLDSGEVALREIADPAEVPAALERWRGFRREQWQAAGRTIDPEHVSQRFLAFMTDAVSALLPTGTALVWEFSSEQRVVGTYVNFADADAYYWYLGGFAPAATSLGLGKIAIAHGIRASIAAGRRRYDFTRGPEPYKYWYGAEDRFLHSLVVGTGHPRSRFTMLGARTAIAVRKHRIAPRG